LPSLFSLGAGNPMMSNQPPRRENYQSDDAFIEAMANHYEIPLWAVKQPTYETLMASEKVWEETRKHFSNNKDDSIIVKASVSCGKSIIADMSISAWQPMETAPKDGTYFLAGFHDDFPDRKVWAAMCQWECGSFHVQEMYPIQPDFWMPLPPPPTE
jgi:hypothetical protein